MTMASLLHRLSLLAAILKGRYTLRQMLRTAEQVVGSPLALVADGRSVVLFAVDVWGVALFVSALDVLFVVVIPVVVLVVVDARRVAVWGVVLFVVVDQIVVLFVVDI